MSLGSMILWKGLLEALIALIQVVDDPEVRAWLQKIYDEVFNFVNKNTNKIIPPSTSVLPDEGGIGS